MVQLGQNGGLRTRKSRVQIPSGAFQQWSDKMLSEKKVKEMYDQVSDFLYEQDSQDAPSDIVVYENAIHEYCLLHKILQVKTPRKWEF